MNIKNLKWLSCSPLFRRTKRVHLRFFVIILFMNKIIELIKLYIAAGSPCIMHALTGWYCPGCGGTRSVLFLLHGHPVMSFLYHPLVLYTAVVIAYILLRHIYDLIRTKSFRAQKKYFRTSMLWVALLITVINFLVKNIALVIFHIDLLTI